MTKVTTAAGGKVTRCAQPVKEQLLVQDVVPQYMLHVETAYAGGPGSQLSSSILKHISSSVEHRGCVPCKPSEEQQDACCWCSMQTNVLQQLQSM